MQIASLLAPGAVFAPLMARDKKQALRLMAEHAARMTGLGEKEVVGTLMEREHQGCTGLGGGVCIPHGRFRNLAKPWALFARLEPPIDFSSADARPVDLVFLLLSPEAADTLHLKALATLSRLLRDKTLCAALRKAKSAGQIYELLTLAGEEEKQAGTRQA